MKFNPLTIQIKTAFILSLLVLIVAGLRISAINDKKDDIQSPDTTMSFCNGYDWNHLDSLPIPKSQINQIKTKLLWVTQSSCRLSGETLLPSNNASLKHIEKINQFYALDDNKLIPIFFALKMVIMAETGTSDLIIQIYKLIVLQKLKNSRLINAESN